MAEYAIAKERGFYAGRMVNKGQRFKLTDGDSLPGWAVADGEKVPEEVVKPLTGDTKPEDAVAAVRKKAKGISDAT